MKKLKNLLLFVLVTIICFAVGCSNTNSGSNSISNSSSGSENNAEQQNVFIINDTTIYGLTGYGKTLSTITIPNYITTIEEMAFAFCENITEVKFEDNSRLTNIEPCAFSFCENLINVTLPNSLTNIGEEAFYGCDNLECVTEDNLKYLGNPQNPYLYLLGVTTTNITTATIKNNCKFIGYEAFYNCQSLTSVDIPNSVISIDSDAFGECNSLRFNEKNDFNYLGNSTNPYLYLAGVRSKSITSATLDANCKIIGDYAFYWCTSLTSVTIGENVTSIGYRAFDGCSSLSDISVDKNNKYYTTINGNLYNKDASVLVQYAKGKQDTSFTIPNSVTSIGYYAFSNSQFLTSVVLLNSVINVRGYAFSDCDSLTSVEIPNSVISIGVGAFADCYNLTSITIPNNVINIGMYAFAYCNSLQYNVQGDLKYIGNSQNPYLYLAGITSDEFSSATINDNCKFMAEYSLSYCNNLTSITIPNSVTSIERGAFKFCLNLTSITIGSGVNFIGEEAFSYCDKLTNIIVDSQNQNYISIDGSLYNKNATKLLQYAIGKQDATFTIPNSVKSIGLGAFGECDNLTSITIPNNVINIGKYAFSSCKNLTNVTIGESVKHIKFYAFGECDNLTNVNFVNKNGWFADSTQISSTDLEDTAKAAEYLTNTYGFTDWKRIV